MKVDFSKFSYSNLEGYKRIKPFYDKNKGITQPSFEAICPENIVAKLKNTATKESKNKYNITAKSINIAGTNCIQNKHNQRQVKDYIREFLKNDRKFTILYDQYTDTNKRKDMTVILIPSSRSKWDFLTITLDAKVPETECRKMVNNLISKKITNIDNSNFKKEILDFFAVE